jgi:hypothetical protein
MPLSVGTGIEAPPGRSAEHQVQPVTRVQHAARHGSDRHGSSRLRLAEHWTWAGEITAAVTRLQALPSG